MKTLWQNLGVLMLCGALALPMSLSAQNRANRGSNGNSRTTNSTSRSVSNDRKATISSGQVKQARPTGSTPSRGQSVNSGKNNNSSRPGGNSNSNVGTRPGSGNQNHGNSSNNAGTRPGSSNRPGNPGSNNSGNLGNNSGSNSGGHGNSGTKPGGTKPGSTKPGGNNYRPGQGSGHGSGHNPGYNPGHNPGHNSGHGPGYGNSAPRPGVGNMNMRPSHIPTRPRWERPMPPPPPRYNYVRVGVPSISGILGLTFGSYLNWGINTLLNAGYNVAAAIDNAIFLSNVNQFGVLWPEATVYYNDGLMNGARFQYSSYSPSQYRFNNVYTQLCRIYGSPVTSQMVNGVNVITWWGGNNTGYITLQYGPGYNQNGVGMYFTDLIYGNAY